MSWLPAPLTSSTLRTPFNCPFTAYTKLTVHQSQKWWYLHVSTRMRRERGVNWMISFVGFCKFHVSTPVSSHWSSEILKLDDTLTRSLEHIHTTDKEQKQTIPSEADKATSQVRAGPPLFCYWGASVSVHVCVLVYVCVGLTVHMCICLGKGSRWTRGHCCELKEFVRVIQCPLSPRTPSWLRVLVLKRGRGEEVRRVKLGPPLPLFSPCPPCSETKYAHTLMISVYLL